jgi:hypothetical protein
MSGENVELVGRLLEAFNRGEYASCLDFLDSAVEWQGPQDLPEAGVLHGRGELNAVWEAWVAAWDFEEEPEWRLIKLVDVREELRLLEVQRYEQMLEATRERMREHGIEMPEAQTAWGGGKRRRDRDQVPSLRTWRSPVRRVPGRSSTLLCSERFRGREPGRGESDSS